MEQTNTETPPPKDGRTDDGNGETGEQVSVTAYNAVKGDMHKYKEEARKNAEALKAFQDKEMQQKEQWKEFGKAKEGEAVEYKNKYDTLVSSINDRSKIAAVKSECIKLGLIDAAADDLEILEMKDVVVETTSTGRVNVIGAKSAAERIKSLKPHWFNDQRAPNVNGRPPGVNNGTGNTVTYADLTKLEAEAKKSGDQTEYAKALRLFKTQQR